MQFIQTSDTGSKKGVYIGQLVILWKISALWAYYYSKSLIVWGPKIQFLALRLDWKMVGLKFNLHLVFRISSKFPRSINYFCILSLTPWTCVDDWLSLELICYKFFNCALVIYIFWRSDSFCLLVSC